MPRRLCSISTLGLMALATYTSSTRDTSSLPPRVPATVDTAALPSAGHEASRPGPAQTQSGRGSPLADRRGESGATIEQRRRVLARPLTGARLGVMLAAIALVVVGGAIIAVLLLSDGSGGSNPGINANAGPTSGTYIASGPWRLKVYDNIHGHDPGCTVRLTDAHSGSPIQVSDGLDGTLYGITKWQIQQTGSINWRVNNAGCQAVPEAGPGTATLPLVAGAYEGDTDAFAVPPRLAVQVTDKSSCTITLVDPVDGQTVDFGSATPGKDNNTVVLNANGHSTAYLGNLSCNVDTRAAQ
jgi:hypothetical protein